MTEISEHKIYKLIQEKYNRIGCDYIILSSNEEYKGLKTHKKAVINAFKILNVRFSSYELNINIETDKMNADKITIDELLEVPSDEYFTNKKNNSQSYTVSTPIPYWYAFLEPPSGTPYLKSDFIEFNNILIPNRSDIEIYRWNDDFSNYFDDGKEWWGTALWSIYDIKSGIFIIIGASLTD